MVENNKINFMYITIIIIHAIMISLSVILIYSQIAQDHYEWMHRELKGFCRYRIKALYFWSLGISLYLELFCFLSFISFVLRKLT